MLSNIPLAAVQRGLSCHPDGGGVLSPRPEALVRRSQFRFRITAHEHGCIAAISVRAPSGTNRAALTFLIQAMVLVNALIPHIAASLVLRAYTPGVLTAVVVNVPFSLWLFWNADRNRFLSRKQIVFVLISGAALLLPRLQGMRALVS